MVALLIGVGVRLNASDLAPVTGELPPPAITPCPDLPADRPPRAGEVKEGRRPARRRRRLVLDRTEHGGTLHPIETDKLLDLKHGISVVERRLLTSNSLSVTIC